MFHCSNPDVMLEAYFEHPYSPLFFVAYLAITFYYLMNVVSSMRGTSLVPRPVAIPMFSMHTRILNFFLCALKNTSKVWV